MPRSSAVPVSRAQAQACCAGGSAVTPARLEPHEQALVGAELRAGDVLGSYETDGRYLGNPSGATEFDFEQDLFGAVRVLRRGQFALLVPFVETQRQTQRDGGHLGGGVGDINASVRYDFFLAGESRYVPGSRFSRGVTLPTGRAPESATAPLAVDATGIGAWQANVALALEQIYGPWLINATGIVAKRTRALRPNPGHAGHAPRGGRVHVRQRRGDRALRVVRLRRGRDDLRRHAVPTAPSASRRCRSLCLWPLGDWWRLFGGLYVEPPISGFGSNQPSVSGLTLTVIRSWS